MKPIKFEPIWNSLEPFLESLQIIRVKMVTAKSIKKVPIKWADLQKNRLVLRNVGVGRAVGRNSEQDGQFWWKTSGHTGKGTLLSHLIYVSHSRRLKTIIGQKKVWVFLRTEIFHLSVVPFLRTTSFKNIFWDFIYF